ncbi:MAG TPA: hypothetical protein DCS93_16635 [Microscillaceae bacterium]|nr:hypothetical protein [Microscillaceae bacterium]
MKQTFLSLTLTFLLINIAFTQQIVTLQKLSGHQHPITHVKFNEDSQYLVSADQSGTIKVWNTSTGKCIQTLRDFKKQLLDLDIKGLKVAATSLDKTVKVWEYHSGKLIFTKKTGYVTDLKLIDYDNLLIHKSKTKLRLSGLLVGQVNTNEKEIVELWDTKKNKQLDKLRSPNISQMTLAPFHDFLVLSKDQNKITRYSAFRKIRRDHHFKFAQKITVAKSTPDYGKLVVAFGDGTLQFISEKSRKAYKTLRLDQPAKQIHFNQPSIRNNTPTRKGFVVLDNHNTLKAYGEKDTQRLGKVVAQHPIQDFRVIRNKVITVESDVATYTLFIRGYAGLFEIPAKTRVLQQVQKALKKWEQKDKFEKSSDYVKRVTEANRQKQIKVLTQEAVNALAQKNLNWKKARNKYDADNETYKIDIDNTYTFYLKVPLSEAKKFDKHFAGNYYQNPQFTLDDQGRFHLLHVEVKNHYFKKYVYDNTQQVAFNSNQLAIKLAPIQIKVATNSSTKPTPPTSSTKPKVNQTTSSGTPQTAEVDLNLPKTHMQNRDAIAVVIGNRNYLKTKEVKFAINDARSIKKYLIEVLGFQPGNIYYQENATKGDFEILFGNQSNYQGKLYNTVKADKSDVFVFYSGHGAPDTKNFKGYFVPVECDPQYVSLAGYAIDVFYNNLAKLPAKSVTVVLDACFSGAEILKNISPIGIKSKGIKGIKNGTLLASSQSTQVSSWYNAKQHGMFTYFFLKAIHNKNADANRDNQLTFKEVYQYITNQTEGVPYWARRLHNVEQMPALKGKNKERVLVKY